MSEKFKDYLRMVVVSLVVSILVTSIRIDLSAIWGFISSIVANDIIKMILAFVGGMVLVILIRVLFKRRRR